MKEKGDRLEGPKASYCDGNANLKEDKRANAAV